MTHGGPLTRWAGTPGPPVLGGAEDAEHENAGLVVE